MKRTFLLFEVLIAIFLVSLCLIPLIRSPIFQYQKTIRLLEEVEGERWAEWTFSEIREKLLNNDLRWDALPSPGQTSHEFGLPPITLELPGLPPKKIERSFRLRCSKRCEKEGVHGEIYRVLKVDLFFSPCLIQPKKNGSKKYTFRTIVSSTKKQ